MFSSVQRKQNPNIFQHFPHCKFENFLRFSEGIIPNYDKVLQGDRAEGLRGPFYRYLIYLR